MSAHSTTFILGALLTIIALAAAKQQYVFNPTSAAPSATALAGGHGYTYVGCWNETVGFRSNDGARALAGGRHSTNLRMTTSICLEYCSKGKNGQAMQYAGVEYGQECWCSTSLSQLSEKLNESSRCTHSCTGNASEVCGGELALSLYNLTSSVDSKTGLAWSQFSGAAGYGTLAVITLIIAAVM